MKKPPKFYRVVITAPDGRFGTKIIEGGVDKKLADHEKKRYKDMGMVVSVFPETIYNKPFQADKQA